MSIWEQSILLKVENLNVYYDQFHVIQDLSLEVLAGEAVGLVGPNGHGKSTLLKAICGLIADRFWNCVVQGRADQRQDRARPGAARPRLRSRGSAPVSRDDGAREPDAGRLSAPRTAMQGGESAACVRALSATRGAPGSARQHAERRRGADVGAWSRLDVRSRFHGDRRTVPGLGAQSRADHARHHRTHQEVRHHHHADRTEHLSAGEIHRPRVRAGRRKNCRRELDQKPSASRQQGFKERWGRPRANAGGGRCRPSSRPIRSGIQTLAPIAVSTDRSVTD